jgi:hypothetical protein
MPKKSRNALGISTFDAGQEAGIGLLERALLDIIVDLGLARQAAEAISSLTIRLVRDALGRARPNRISAYLEQWNHFLIGLPEQLKVRKESDRASCLLSFVRGFRLQDARGRKVARLEWNDLANVVVEKNGQKWQAFAPSAAPVGKSFIELTDLDTTPSKAGENKNKSSTPSDGEQEVPWPPLDISKARLLKPLNMSASLLDEYERFCTQLRKYPSLNQPDARKALFVGIPDAIVRRWFEGKTQRSGLALLVAAYRVGLAPSLGDLSRFRELLAGARQAKRLAEQGTARKNEIVIVGANRGK